MSSNFERLQKIINAENFMWNPEICQDPLPVTKMIWSFWPRMLSGFYHGRNWTIPSFFLWKTFLRLNQLINSSTTLAIMLLFYCAKKETWSSCDKTIFVVRNEIAVKVHLLIMTWVVGAPFPKSGYRPFSLSHVFSANRINMFHFDLIKFNTHLIFKDGFWLDNLLTPLVLFFLRF